MKCQCVTRWVVDFGDHRGQQPTTALTAALASGIGLRVELASVSDTPMRPITPLPGVTYGGAKTYVAAVCDVCGYPTRMGRVRRPAGRAS